MLCHQPSSVEGQLHYELWLSIQFCCPLFSRSFTLNIKTPTDCKIITSENTGVAYAQYLNYTGSNYTDCFVKNKKMCYRLMTTDDIRLAIQCMHLQSQIKAAKLMFSLINIKW